MLPLPVVMETHIAAHVISTSLERWTSVLRVSAHAQYDQWSSTEADESALYALYCFVD